MQEYRKSLLGAFENSSWNKGKRKMPKYSILEAVLTDTPDFNNLKELTRIIEVQAEYVSEAVLKELERLDMD